MRPPTVTALAAIAAGAALFVTAGMVGVFIGVLLLVAGGVEIALDAERTLGPGRTVPLDTAREQNTAEAARVIDHPAS